MLHVHFLCSVLMQVVLDENVVLVSMTIVQLSKWNALLDFELTENCELWGSHCNAFVIKFGFGTVVYNVF
jgi:hypothetical protein